jgi:hypothetical protein
MAEVTMEQNFVLGVHSVAFQGVKRRFGGLEMVR